VVRGFINPIVVVFQKKLEFMKVFAFRGGLYFVDALVAILLGIYTHSESAMIISMIVAALIEVVLSFTLFRVRPKLKIDKVKFWKVLHSGKWITGAGIFSYIFQNIDNITVGRLLGTTSLGFYQQSYAIANLPVSGVGDIFNRVMFPIFVRISDDVTKLKNAFYKTLAAILSMGVIFGILIVFFSHPIISIFLGQKWLVIEPTLKVLAVFGILKSVLNSTYSLFLALKMQKIVMLSEFFGIVGMAIAVYPLVTQYGTVGAGYATMIAVMCSLPVILINVKKIFH
jgi:PST family polysaccharide transporter/lipopolysaccharide exporter